MKIESRQARTRDGRPFAVRSALPSDAGRVLDLAAAIATREPQWNVPEPGEVTLAAQAIEAAIRRAAAAPNAMHLVAEADGALVGWLTLDGERHAKLRHTAELGMGVAPEWRRQGVGRALLEAMGREARREGALRRVTLSVFASNLPAIGLYRACGFEVEGIQRAQVRIGETFVDRLLMALDLATP